MAWDHLSITSAHLVYIILGGFTSIFMLCSSVIKERMYIGEATVATIVGIIFGPHAANLINPKEWGNVDEVTLEFSRVVLVVQCFAVGVELPKFYMERHWKSVVFLLIPVMTWGWLLVSVFIWWLVEPLNWVESLVVAACMTATDPVLASSVVGKGKFAKRVPKHLRDLLSAESGCNDGMAFPFVYLGIYLIQEHLSPGESLYHWFVYTVLYECVFGAIYGFAIGYIARHGIKYAERHDLIDRESFLVFYFTLALFCAGSGSMLGTDDLLVGFAAGVGFSNDGWFSEKTEESHVSNVIDLLLNLTYFVYLGTIIPWEQFNDASLGLSAWKLAVLAILVIFFRRIPIMLILKPAIPDVKTWREALFAGHFGPIGVGAIFVAILARAELSVEKTIPSGELPALGEENHYVTLLVWPIVTFMVVASILVHGSSIAVFTLGKRINTLQLTMSYTTAVEDGPTWMNRLPRISSQSKSQARTMSDTDFDDVKSPQFPPGTLGPTGYPGAFLRRQREEDKGSHNRSSSRASSLMSRRRRKRWDDGIGPGGPVSQSAIFPQRQSTGDNLSVMSPTENEKQDAITPQAETPSERQARAKDNERSDASTSEDNVGPKGEEATELQVYDEGDHVIIEDQDGQVLAIEDPIDNETRPNTDKLKEKAMEEIQKPGWTYESFKRTVKEWRDDEIQKRKEKPMARTRHAPARAYQFGNTIIVEDEDGEVVKKYELPSEQGEGKDYFGQGMKLMGMGGLVEKKGDTAGEPSAAGPSSRPGIKQSFSAWGGFKRGGAAEGKKKAVETDDSNEPTEEDDRQIRFTIGGVGRRMTKEDFLKEVQMLDSRTRREVVDQSNASAAVKTAAKQDIPTIREPESTRRPSPRKEQTVPDSQAESSTSSSSSGKSPVRPQGGEARGRSSTTGSAEHPSTEEPETAAERRRRLAAFATVRDDTDADETPAERRRREAALGRSDAPAEDSDSDDDNTPRVPPAARRGIRFADDARPRA
ncbi:alkali metal cation/H+ antiporter Nha1 C terminus-domain-containing protein [Microdochium trichocladiopsis]|uniref:Alkali metal cation/H+ antiporter Nha1 C terminus-domain-containing protein n=1 Tax=Microdochium trichocladiopsis TaxID=1682393 RepID=A0A9P8YEJ8_9PEZI|nr:alkali metal cation/H+ antiporter Nha1 C terminus-domain-containing protein [Microdochium trichocladiopsis]KAH7037878.1 alkali metal cation/H+ antiporter Nha1 C terminus-domain-containing protein [Microdochium trichocladiopsis]